MNQSIESELEQVRAAYQRMMKNAKAWEEKFENLQQAVESWHNKAATALEALDNQAKLWGDEGVNRRCRDELREVVSQMKGSL